MHEICTITLNRSKLKARSVQWLETPNVGCHVVKA